MSWIAYNGNTPFGCGEVRRSVDGSEPTSGVRFGQNTTQATLNRKAPPPYRADGPCSLKIRDPHAAPARRHDSQRVREIADTGRQSPFMTRRGRMSKSTTAATLSLSSDRRGCGVRPSFGFSVGRLPASDLARRRNPQGLVRAEGPQMDSSGLTVETCSTPLPARIRC